MPGRSPAEARENFLAPLRRSLSCITSAQLFVSGGKKAGETEALALSEDPVSLRSGRMGSIQLVLGHQFRVVQDGRKSWHVSTAAYRYHLLDCNGCELIAWHWHPGTGSGHPHLHMAAGRIDRRAHLPTGRVSIESVLRLLLTDFDVQPAKDHAHDFLQVLEASEEPFIRHRRWHAWRRT